MNQKTKGSNNAMKRVVSVILIFAMVFTVGSFQAVFAVESGDVVQDKQDLIGENNEVPVLNEGDAESNPNAEVAEPQQEIDVIREQGRINYLYIESPSIAPNQQQNIVVSFGDGSENLNNIELKVSCPDGSTDKLTPSRIEKEIIVFTNTYDVENIGVFTLDSFCVSVDGVTQEIVLSEAGIEATFNVALGAEIVEEDISASVIDLSGEEDVETAVEATLESNAVKLNNNELSRNVLSRSANGNIVVVLDPGHGGRDPGASGNGLVESQVNLAIALACRDELQQYAGVEVVLTRTTDVHLGADTAADLEARVQIAKDAGADLFVCLHNNSASSSASGAEVYYPNSNHNSSVHNSGKNVAQLIQNELVALGFDNRGIKEGYSSDGSGDDAFYVIRECKAVGIPAVLVEHGFLTNASDAARLREPEKLGIANANAIASFFGLTKECALMIKPSRNVTIGDTVTFQIKTEYIENSSQYKSYRVICNPGNGNWVELSSSSKDMIRTWTADRSFTDGTILLEALRVDGTTEPLWSYAQSMSVKPAITKIKSLNFSEISNGKITIDSEIESTDRDLKYTYEVYDMNTWKGLVTESENSKVEWKPSKTGQYLINLTVKGKYGEKTSLAWGTEVKANASILSFTANKSTPQTVGSQMTLSGRADISFMSPTYRYIYYDGTSWNEIASSKVQKDVMWTPQKAGNYLLCYQILMPDGSNIDRFMGYDITGPSLTINNLTVSSLSGDGKITLNSKVTSTDTDLKYTYEVYDMKTWSTVKKDSSSSAVEWTPKKEGTYLVNVTVTGKSGTRESRAVGTSVVGTANITKFTVDKNTPRAIGEEITLSGRASVNMQNATYRYIYYDGKTWNLIASDTSQKDAVWKPQKAGNYTLCYQVVMPGGREVNRFMGYDITGPSLTINNLTVSGLSGDGKITLNSKVTSTDTELKYTYEVYDMKTWSTVKRDSSTSAVEWTPKKEGTYLVNVTVTGKSGTRESRAVGTSVVGTANITKFTVDKNTPRAIGEEITLSGRASVNMQNATYRYIYYDGKTWNLITSDTSQKDAVWKPQKAGNYTLCYQVVMPGGREVNRFMGYDITGPSLTINNLTVSGLSGDGKITLNSKVTSTDTELKYTYEVYDMKTWSTVKRDSSTSAVEWTPKKEGTYLVNVTVTGKSGTRESRAVGTSVVGTANITKFTVDKNTPRAIGEEITLSGRASVNMQNATYRYIYYDGKTWNLIASDTSQKDAVWKPQKAGNYTLCYQVVMPGGREVNRFMGYDITGPFLTIKSLTASSLSRYGKVTLNTEVTTTDTDLKYTYEVYDMKVWNTVKKDSSTSAVEWTPTKEGTYLVNVTVTSASGLKESYAVGTEVAYQAEITGFTLDKSNPQTVGTVIGMLGSAKVDVEGAIFRYIYFDGVTWNEIYSSNKLERATWTPTRASEYDICFQIILPNGRILNKMYHYHITDVHSILGKTEVSVQQLCNYYKKSGATFPTDRYKCPTGKNPSDYASTLEAFCTMYVQEANKYGVKAEVAFVQAMLETNYLRYGGDVKAEQFNFAGLGATGNGEPGNVFANVRTGVKAQIQHLYCYASTEPLPSGELLVDQRWSNNLRGKAPYVEWLAIKKNPYGTGWAAAEDYGESIVKGLKIIQGL